MNIRDMKANRAAVLDEAQKIVEAAEVENRGLTSDEGTRIDELTAKAEAMLGDINRMETVAQMRGQEAAKVGMNTDEVKAYSLIRAINAAEAARRGDPKAWNGAGLELEASHAVEKQLGREARGFFLPYDVQVRDLTVGTPSAGGYLKGTDTLGGSFIDVLRAKMVTRAAGARILSGLVGSVAIPALTAATTAYWVAESGAPTEGAPTFGQVALSPKTVGAYVDISRKLLKQSSIDVEMMLRNDLASQLANALDTAGLHGSGSSNEPTGIDHTSGIGSVAGGTDGAAPDWADVVDLETEVATDNADIGSLAYITNPKVRGKLKKTMRTATYGDIPIWENGAQPLNGYPVHVTTNVSHTLTKGSSTGVGVCSAIFFGNWADLIYGLWGGLDILADPYSGSTTGTLRIVAFQDADVAVRHAESFAAMLDALTS